MASPPVLLGMLLHTHAYIQPPSMTPSLFPPSLLCPSGVKGAVGPDRYSSPAWLAARARDRKSVV